MASLASLVIFFAASAAAAYGIVALAFRARRRLSSAAPVPGSILRVRADAAIYRAHLLSTSEQEWTISAPLQRDRYVPPHVGDPILVEASTAGGALRFRSQIVGRTQGDREFSIAPPREARVEERRSSQRVGVEQDVVIDGGRGTILNLSSGGARVRLGLQPRRGDRMLIRLAESEVGAWVLEAEGYEARIRFEETIDPGCLQSETAPAW